jgi:multidrug efflux pump subunit AcrB
LAIAILISAVNALTLSPALSALFLKSNHGANTKPVNFKQRFFKDSMQVSKTLPAGIAVACVFLSKQNG